MNLNSQFDQFIHERIYIRNVTPKTRDWYQSAWQAFKASRLESGPDSPITRADLTQFVIHLRECVGGTRGYR